MADNTKPAVDKKENNEAPTKKSETKTNVNVTKIDKSAKTKEKRPAVDTAGSSHVQGLSL